MGLPGRLVCRIETTGTKIFFFRYRTAGTDRLIHLGKYDSRGRPYGLTLDDAGTKAREFAERLKSTPDLKEALELEDRADQAARRRQLDDAKEGDKQTLAALLEVYVGNLKRDGKGAATDARGLFQRHVVEAFPSLAAAPASTVEARDVAKMVRRLIEQGKDRTAGKLRSYLAAAFTLALRAETDAKAPSAALAFKLTGNPAAATKAHSGVKARNRVLTPDELRHYMERAQELPEAQRDALALLLLLAGQRPVQLLRARVPDINKDDRTLSLLDNKGRRREPRVHLLPLSDAAEVILDRRTSAAHQLGTDLLFTSDGKTAVRLETISSAVKSVSDKMVKAKQSKVGFQLRDIRRTCETLLAASGVSKETRAQLLSHGISGVQAQHYDRHQYMNEKAAALAGWEARLAEIRSGVPAPSNVKQLKRG